MALAAVATLAVSAVVAPAPAHAQRYLGAAVAGGLIGGAIVGGAIANGPYGYGPGYYGPGYRNFDPETIPPPSRIVMIWFAFTCVNFSTFCVVGHFTSIKSTISTFPKPK